MGFFNDAGEAFNEVTDTIGDAAEQGISDAEEAFNYDDGPVVVDTTPSDNNFDGRPDNRKEEVPKPSEPDNRKEEVPKPSEPDNRKEEPPKPSEPAEAANKYKGIIQLAVLAVGIAGTIGAYLWASN